MKKIAKLLVIIMLFTFLLLPENIFAKSAIWSKSLDLTDSVSSSIIKVEDGVIIMQYEGSASSDNYLIKYDFDGNKKWAIQNNYGFNISGVSDGFIIWNDKTITKFDKDQNIEWQNISPKPANYDNYTSGYLCQALIEVNDGYVLYSKNVDDIHIFKLDKNGSLQKMISKYSISEAFGKIAGLVPIKNGTNIALIYAKHHSLDLKIYDTNFNLIKEYSDSNSSLDDNAIGYHTKEIIATNDGYLLGGKQLVHLDTEGKIKKISDKNILSLVEINGDYYTHEIIEDSDDSTIDFYDTAIVKYDNNLNKQSSTQLPLSLFATSITGINAPTGFAQIKNQIVFIENNSNVDSIVLNVPFSSVKTTYDDYYERDGYMAENILSASYSISRTGIARYRVSGSTELDEDNKNNNGNISGIINNIIKNPQTNSIIIVSVVIVIILIVSIISYIVYKKKNRKKQ